MGIGNQEEVEDLTNRPLVLLAIGEAILALGAYLFFFPNALSFPHATLCLLVPFLPETSYCPYFSYSGKVEAFGINLVVISVFVIGASLFLQLRRRGMPEERAN